MSAPKYGMHEGVELAMMRAVIALAAAQDHDWRTVFDGAPGVTPLVQHPTARIGSCVDDVIIDAIEHGGWAL